MKTCERCQVREALKGERFCEPCRSAVLNELHFSGYLTPYPYNASRPRDVNARENTRETKFGPGSK